MERHGTHKKEDAEYDRSHGNKQGVGIANMELTDFVGDIAFAELMENMALGEGNVGMTKNVGNFGQRIDRVAQVARNKEKHFEQNEAYQTIKHCGRWCNFKCVATAAHMLW